MINGATGNTSQFYNVVDTMIVFTSIIIKWVIEVVEHSLLMKKISTHGKISR